MINCNLCSASFDSTDPLINKMLERHELGRHTPHSVVSERDGSILNKHGMGNLIYGKVEWQLDDKELLYHARHHNVVIRNNHIVCKACNLILERP
jgi:hypothetical protein